MGSIYAVVGERARKASVVRTGNDPSGVVCLNLANVDQETRSSLASIAQLTMEGHASRGRIVGGDGTTGCDKHDISGLLWGVLAVYAPEAVDVTPEAVLAALKAAGERERTKSEEDRAILESVRTSAREHATLALALPPGSWRRGEGASTRFETPMPDDYVCPPRFEKAYADLQLDVPGFMERMNAERAAVETTCAQARQLERENRERPRSELRARVLEMLASDGQRARASDGLLLDAEWEHLLEEHAYEVITAGPFIPLQDRDLPLPDAESEVTSHYYSEPAEDCTDGQHVAFRVIREQAKQIVALPIWGETPAEVEVHLRVHYGCWEGYEDKVAKRVSCAVDVTLREARITLRREFEV